MSPHLFLLEAIGSSWSCLSSVSYILHVVQGASIDLLRSIDDIAS